MFIGLDKMIALAPKSQSVLTSLLMFEMSVYLLGIQTKLPGQVFLEFCRRPLILVKFLFSAGTDARPASASAPWEERRPAWRR